MCRACGIYMDAGLCAAGLQGNDQQEPLLELPPVACSEEALQPEHPSWKSKFARGATKLKGVSAFSQVLLCHRDPHVGCTKRSGRYPSAARGPSRCHGYAIALVTGEAKLSTSHYGETKGQLGARSTVLHPAYGELALTLRDSDSNANPNPVSNPDPIEPYP